MKNIFLIDDDPISIFLTKKIISNANPGVEVSEFGDGDAAIRHLKAIADKEMLLPDIILLDLNMPVMDGWSFLDEFRTLSLKMRKKIWLYIVSSSISPMDIERSRSFRDVRDFIIKPLQKEQLMKIIEMR